MHTARLAFTVLMLCLCITSAHAMSVNAKGPRALFNDNAAPTGSRGPGAGAGSSPTVGDKFPATVLDGAMKGPGGTIKIDIVAETRITGSDRTLGSGQIVGGSTVSLPEPAAVATFAMGIVVGFVILRRRGII